MTFRAFIAVELSGLGNIKALVDEIDALGAPFKLVRPENMHITLKFLGDTPEAKIPDILKVMEAACSGHNSFEIGYRGLGAFPNRRKMSVVWAGVTGAEQMKTIADGIDSGLEPLGFRREKRPFKPHLTLGRLRKYGKLDTRAFNSMQELFQTYDDQEMGGCTVDRIVLKKSTLTPRGPIYEDVEEVCLKTGGAAGTEPGPTA